MGELEFKLLNDFQRDFPLVARPYAELARRLSVDEATVIAALTLCPCKCRHLPACFIRRCP